MEGDCSALYHTARALMRLQARFGAFPVIKGVGGSALAVADMLKRMRAEVGVDAPLVGAHACARVWPFTKACQKW